MYPGFDGFLGTRATFMLDLVFLAMFLVVPVMAWSIYQVKYRQRYLLHKRMQQAIGAVLLLVVVVFEIDIRLYGWKERAADSPYFNGDWNELWAAGWVNWSLWIHLIFAVSTTFVWVYTIVQAQRKIPHPPGPCEYSARHKFWGTLAAADLALTAFTGWIFYWLAFVATAT